MRQKGEVIKQRHAVEALLRPRVELWAALASTAGAGLALSAPWSLMMTPSVAYAVGGILSFNAYRNYNDYFRLRKYQKGLREMSLYKLAPSEVRVSRKKLFLGLGFEWGQAQTQRLKDTKESINRHFVNLDQSYLWARRKEVEWESEALFKYLSQFFASDSQLNPFKPLPPIGGHPEIHGVGGYEEEISIPLSDRNGHTLVLGTTRVGKTRLAEILITQDIRRGDTTIVFDPKGDSELMRRVIAEAKAAGREDDLIIFHLGFPDISARYNGIGHFNRVTEVATRTANQLDSGGNSTVFREFFWRFTNIIAQALVALGRRPDYKQLAMHIQNIEGLMIDYYEFWFDRVAEKGWREEVKAIKDTLNPSKLDQKLRGKNKHAIALFMFASNKKHYDSIAAGLLSTFEYDKTYFDKIVASGLPLLEKLITGRIAELISPAYDDPEDMRPVFSWGQVIRQNKIVYIGLDALQDSTIAGTVGNTMFADLVSEAGSLYKHGEQYGFHEQSTESGSRNPIYIHADEVNELMGDEFIPMLNKAGGAGYMVTAYTQTLSDLSVKLGDDAKAGQVVGNFNSVIMFRVKELSTAELITEQLSPVDVVTAMEVSGATDSVDLDSEADFTSNTQDRVTAVEVDLLHPSTIMQLPKGQAFMLTAGGVLFKIRVPLADSSNDEFMEAEFSAMASEMKSKYITSENWWSS